MVGKLPERGKILHTEIRNSFSSLGELSNIYLRNYSHFLKYPRITITFFFEYVPVFTIFPWTVDRMLKCGLNAFGAGKAWMILGGGCLRRLLWCLQFILLRCKIPLSRCSLRWVILQSRINRRLNVFYVYTWTFFSNHELIIMTCFSVFKNSFRDRMFKICFIKC